MKKAILGALFAGAMLASCSDDSIINDGPGDVTEGEGRYITFNIMASPSTPSSRGTSTDPKFENGLDFENTAETAVFLFFDAAGNSTQSPQTATITWENNKNDDKVALDNISTTTVVIAGNTQPTQVICVLNPPTSLTSVTGQTLTEVRKRINDYSVKGEGDSRRILMSNSVYVDNGNEICATDITGKTFETPEKAQEKDNIVEIYVERVLAKVRTNIVPATGKTFEQTSSIKINDSTVVIRPQVIGIEVANAAKQARLLKSIQGWDTWATQWTSWNDPDNKRCYWAYTQESMNGFANQSWNAINTKDDKGNVIYTPTNQQNFYIHPNTTATKTSVLITAQLIGSDNKPVENFLYWGGNYYMQGDDPTKLEDITKYKGFLSQYATNIMNEGYRINYVDKSTSKQVYQTLLPTDLRWITESEHDGLTKLTNSADKFKGYEMTATVNTDALKKRMAALGLGDEDWHIVIDSKTKDAENNIIWSPSSTEDIYSFLKTQRNRVWLWNKGMCYYFANIEHFGPYETQTLDGKNVRVPNGWDYSEGVVRNHIYDLSLESVKGVGTPVFNPEEIIIPEKPNDELYYLAARINILKWRLVKQTVNFN